MISHTPHSERHGAKECPPGSELSASGQTNQLACNPQKSGFKFRRVQGSSADPANARPNNVQPTTCWPSYHTMKKCTYCGQESADDAVNCSGCGLEEFEADQPAPPEKLDDQEELVTLISCQKLIDADLVATKLGSAGIETFIPDQYLMQTIGFNLNTYGYVRVQVRRKDYANAKDLLEKPEDG